MKHILPQNIVEQLGLSNLSPKEQEASVLAIGEVIYRAILMRAIEALSDDDATAFEKFLDEKKHDPVQVLEHLRSKISNFDEIIQEEVVKFVEHSRNMMSKMGA